MSQEHPNFGLPTDPPPHQQWEAVPGRHGRLWHVRWSETDTNGNHLYVGHYPSTPWGIQAAQTHAQESNLQGVHILMFI